MKVLEPNITKEDIQSVVSALDRTDISGRSPVVEDFERQFAQYLNIEYASACNSGSSALFLALKAIQITGEVIVPDFAYIAVPNAVVQAGLTPALAEVSIDGNLTAKTIKQAISPRTSAILVVHTYGVPCNMDEIMDLADHYNLAVIEDVAEAHGGEWNGKKLGTFGDVGCFSFFANKTMTTGEGGMVVTNNPAIAQNVDLLKDQFTTERYWHPGMGYSLAMSGLQAALGISQLRRLDSFLARKKEIHDLYAANIKTWNNTGTFWVNGILHEKRDELLSYLAENGVEARAFFPPIHTQKIYKQDGLFLASSMLGRYGLYLPSSTTMEDEDVLKVAELINNFDKQYGTKNTNQERSDRDAVNGDAEQADLPGNR